MYFINSQFLNYHLINNLLAKRCLQLIASMDNIIISDSTIEDIVFLNNFRSTSPY